MFPQCRVEGGDLSAIQPLWAPPNVDFYIDDMSYLDMSYHRYDYIHVRGLNGCFQDWHRFYSSVLTSLIPGGWVEQAELDWRIFGLESPLLDDDPLMKLQKSLFEASRVTGRPLDVCDRIFDSLKAAGFSQVHGRTVTCPIGGWPEGETHKTWGKLAYWYWKQGLEDMCLALLTRFLGVCQFTAQEAPLMSARKLNFPSGASPKCALF